MKEIDKKDEPDVSGGYRPEGGCFPTPVGYPTSPIVPVTDPIPGPVRTEDPL